MLVPPPEGKISVVHEHAVVIDLLSCLRVLLLAPLHLDDFAGILVIPIHFYGVHFDALIVQVQVGKDSAGLHESVEISRNGMRGSSIFKFASKRWRYSGERSTP